MHSLNTYLLIFLGAGIGGAMRHAVNRAAAALGVSSVAGTLLVNVSGCLAAGLIAGFLTFRGESSQSMRLFLITGILGGYTTFSAYSLDVVLLRERGDVAAAVAYAAGSVILSIAAVAAGLVLMRP
jgi:CrcB protein